LLPDARHLIAAPTAAFDSRRAARSDRSAEALPAV